MRLRLPCETASVRLGGNDRGVARMIIARPAVSPSPDPHPSAIPGCLAGVPHDRMSCEASVVTAAVRVGDCSGHHAGLNRSILRWAVQ